MKKSIAQLTISLLFGLVFLSGCQSADQEYMQEKSKGYGMNDMEEPAYEQAQMTSYQEPGAQDKEAATQQMIIKTADVRLQVNDFKAFSANAEKLVKSFGGYISYENNENNTYQTQGEMTIRVRSSDFDTLVNSLVAIGDFLHRKSINLQDVTEEYVDVTARLKARRELEQRYSEILKKAGTVEEILQVEQELGNIREKIEVAEGRKNLLEHQVSYSTINLFYFQEKPRETAPGQTFVDRLVQGFGNGWEGFLAFLVVLVNLWPFFIFGGVSFWLLRKWWKHRKAKKAGQ